MNILIISENVAPAQAVASIRWTKFSKYLSKEHNFSVTVLTNEKGFTNAERTLKRYKYDSTLSKDMSWYRTVYVPRSTAQSIVNIINNCIVSLRDARRNRLKRSNSKSTAERECALVDALLSICVVVCDWMTGLAFRLSAEKTPIDWGDYDVMISTYGPRWPHQVASKIKKLFPNLTWIADYRDPVVSSARSDTPARRRYASKVTRDAEMIIGVSNGTVQNLYLPAEKKTKVLTNGFDGDEVVRFERQRTAKFKIVYTGTLYADDECLRDLSPLFETLSTLIREALIDPRNVVIEYAGATPDLFEQYCNRYPNVPAENRGLLQRGEVLELQNNASALVVCTWNTPTQQGVLTGKIFEYMRSGAPIIGICSGSVPNSDLRELIEGSHLGICYEETEIRGLERLGDYLLSLYGEWKRFGLTSRDNRAEVTVKSYSYSSLTNQLIEIIHEATSQCSRDETVVSEKSDM